MEFKEYTKTYEDVYTRYEAIKKGKIDHVSIDDGMLVSEYKKLCDGFLRKSLIQLFDISVRYYWLQHKFQYMGWKKKKVTANYYPVDVGWAIFLRHHVGIDYRILTRNFFYRKFNSYFMDLFPEFHERNPFEDFEYYKYPYTHVSPDFLTIVEQMPQRFDLLGIAEEKKMIWDEFIDYVINWALCHNDEVGKRVFTIINSKSCTPPYVRNNMLRGRTWRKNKSEYL